MLVQCRSGDAEKRERIVQDVIALMRARHGVDARVQLVGARALPQTSSGKLSRARTKANYLAGLYTHKSAAA